MGAIPSEDFQLAERQKHFFDDYVHPMVVEAREIGVPITEAIVRVIEMHTVED